jgi:taurine dioxygenase
MSGEATIRPVGGALGAEIIGLDLTRPLADEVFEQVRQAWLDFEVIITRDAEIAKDDQLRFARRFGALEEVRTKTDSADERQYVFYIANRGIGGSKGALPDGEMFFHSDQCYYELTARGTLLNALELPSEGGETCFASMTRAYATPHARKDFDPREPRVLRRITIRGSCPLAAWA